MAEQVVMSIPVWIWRREDLSAYEKAVLSVICWRQGDSPNCWPSAERIAADVGMSIRHARRITTQLSEAGPDCRHPQPFLEVTKRAGAVSLYRLLPEPNPGHPVRGDISSGVTSCPLTPDILSGDPGHPVTQNPEKNPEQNPEHTSHLSGSARRTPPTPSADALRAAEYLAERIRMLHPFHRPTPADARRWARDVDKLIRLDFPKIEDTDLTDLRAVIDYATADDRAGFCWQSNVLSGATLRKHYPRILEEIVRNERAAAAKDADAAQAERARKGPRHGAGW
jgi:hypothetical protein